MRKYSHFYSIFIHILSTFGSLQKETDVTELYNNILFEQNIF